MCRPKRSLSRQNVSTFFLLFFFFRLSFFFVRVCMFRVSFVQFFFQKKIKKKQKKRPEGRQEDFFLERKKKTSQKKKTLRLITSSSSCWALDNRTCSSASARARDVRQNNATAVQAVRNIVKSSLGPVGLDKVRLCSRSAILIFDFSIFFFLFFFLLPFVKKSTLSLFFCV